MRPYPETGHEGEWFEDGTVDEWLAAHATSGAPALTDKQVAMVRTLATPPPEGKMWLVYFDTVWQRAHTVGLYDGWVYWKPRICIGYGGTLGFACEEAYHLRNIGIGERTETTNWLGQRFRLVETVGAAS